MKSSEEIAGWLKDKPWYKNFKKNIRKAGELVLNGEKGLSTIVGAFVWSDTKEGSQFWRKVEQEFVEWYGQGSSIEFTHVNEVPDEYKRKEE